MTGLGKTSFMYTKIKSSLLLDCIATSIHFPNTVTIWPGLCFTWLILGPVKPQGSGTEDLKPLGSINKAQSVCKYLTANASFQMVYGYFCPHPLTHLSYIQLMIHLAMVENPLKKQ